MKVLLSRIGAHLPCEGRDLLLGAACDCMCSGKIIRRAFIFRYEIIIVPLSSDDDASLHIGRGGKSKKVDFSFTCARFSADAYYMENDRPVTVIFKDNSSGTKMTFRNFGGFHRMSYGMSAYYIFNNRRYAQAAAYCFSKYQRRSAGSLIAGIRLLHRDMSLNVQELPDFAREQFAEDDELPRFLYNDYCVMVGYGYNWVLGKKWLLNLTLAPYTGYRHMIATQLVNRASDWSMNLRARMGVVYNHKQFFMGLQSYADIHRFKSEEHNFLGSVIDCTWMAGIRF